MDAYTRLINDFPFSPHLPEAFLERGKLRRAAGDRPGALSDFDTVAEACPRSAEAGEARRRAASLRGG
jgi:regulator of sirC expression with transglutaminase-like and TPR domain